MEINVSEFTHELSEITYNWVDITNDFKEAVTDLALGELLHDKLFGLFEAMSAIEMMDPKMDAGMICNRGKKKPLFFDQAVQAGTLKLDNLTNSELIGIIDTTLACMVSWLEGHSLAQTVFTNLYLQDPYLIEDKILKAYCLSVYKMIDIIKDFIHKAMVFEEEDFQPMQYGYRLNPDISEQRMTGMLREVEEDLHRRCRSKLHDDACALELEELLALYNRIKYIRVFYQYLNILLQFTKEDKVTDVNECQRLLASCDEMLQSMKNTVHLGIQQESLNTHCDIMGFEPLINQRLLPPTFPRYTKIKPRSEALDYFAEMIDRFKVVCTVNNFLSFHSALDFLIEFSKSSPCILSRSILQLLYISHRNLIFGSVPFADVLKESVRAFISPPALIKSPLTVHSQTKLYLDNFLSHCTRPFANFIQLCGHNRARQRDKLAQLLEEFTALQDEAERVDAYLHKLSMRYIARPHLACFGTWVLYHTLRIMIMYLLSGFELELYSVHEYHYIYWYLYEFLYGWLVSALTRADSFIVLQDVVETSKNRTNKKKRPNYKKSKPYKYRREIIIFQALQNMCGGFYKALFGFRMDGKIRMPHPQFDSEQVRYEHRFAPFASLLTPPPVQYVEFKEMTSTMRYAQQPVDSTYLYVAGCKHFQQVRSLLESITPRDAEVEDLLKVAKTNFIVLRLLAGGHRKDSTIPPEFEFTFHRHFPVIKLN